MGSSNSVEAASKKGVCNEGDTCFITTIHLPGAKKPVSLPPLVNDLLKWEIYNTTSSEDGFATTVYYRVVVNQEAVLQQQDNKIKQAIALNDEGNEFFKEGKYEEAIEKYKQALETTSNENHKVTYRNNIKLSESNLEAKATSEEDGSDQSYKQEYDRYGYENEDNLNTRDADGEYDYDRHQEVERDIETDDSTYESNNQINTSKIQELQEQELNQLKEEIQNLQLEIQKLKSNTKSETFGQSIDFHQEIPIDIKYEIEKLYDDSEELRERGYEEEQQRNSVIRALKLR